jgi:hypothetical protein
LGLWYNICRKEANRIARLTPVNAAKELGIRPQIVYGYIRANRIATFNNPDGKAALVELEDVKRLAGGTRHHREKDSSGNPIRRTPGVERGTILSTHGEIKGGRKRHAHRVVVVDEIIKGDDGQPSLIYARRSDDGAVAVIYEAERLADAIAKGKCFIEGPEALLGVLMFHFATVANRPDLTASLWNWATLNDIVPVDMHVLQEEVRLAPEDEPEPEVAEEQLAGVE